VALALLYLPLAAWQLPMLANPADTGFRFVPLPTIVASLLTTFAAGVAHEVRWWSVVPMLVLACAAMARAPGVRGPWRLAVLLWLCVPILGLFAISYSRPLFTVRYLVYVLPALALLVSAGAEALTGRSRALAALLTVALLVVGALGLRAQATTPIKADMRSATRYVAAKLRQADLVLFQIPYARYSFQYYRDGPATRLPGRDVSKYHAFLPRVEEGRGGPFRWADGLYTNSGMGEVELDGAMRALTRDSQTVWLVETEADLWDSRGLMSRWLTDRGDLTETATFTRVRVLRFELPR